MINPPQPTVCIFKFTTLLETASNIIVPLHLFAHNLNYKTSCQLPKGNCNYTIKKEKKVATYNA